MPPCYALFVFTSCLGSMASSSATSVSCIAHVYGTLSVISNELADTKLQDHRSTSPPTQQILLEALEFSKETVVSRTACTQRGAAAPRLVTRGRELVPKKTLIWPYGSRSNPWPSLTLKAASGRPDEVSRLSHCRRPSRRPLGGVDTHKSMQMRHTHTRESPAVQTDDFMRMKH